jgi:hypothetical protein
MRQKLVGFGDSTALEKRIASMGGTRPSIRHKQIGIVDSIVTRSTEVILTVQETLQLQSVMDLYMDISMNGHNSGSRDMQVETTDEKTL